jgi:LEA14-like dessication related protein
MHSLKLFFGIFILMLLTACGRYQDINIGELQDFSVKGFVENSLVLSVKVPVNNPTAHKITITGLDAKIYINDQYIGKISSPDPLILNKKSDEVHDIILHVRMADFLGTTAKMLNMKRDQSIRLRLEGTFVAKTCGLRRKVSVDETRDVVL